eukprot:CAMPEP_0119117656 /NCGR_PEP_ID=MMETSP1180-20130426/52956_1 /TAXON_ID=3052 ORGANISM="Chlamydomonas cf sp, Strain CCMP681" /NCGR_SAMPLE_ID=MMETSP1180 /ASSEMBLY_ACC=CAM_ASM_000741 /LENGTH=73 /DNA_ID=CAMNT_0007106933 /DNA_START=1954 /DNA_END=2175 /DNA_ORIENTATION=+
MGAWTAWTAVSMPTDPKSGGDGAAWERTAFSPPNGEQRSSLCTPGAAAASPQDSPLDRTESKLQRMARTGTTK